MSTSLRRLADVSCEPVELVIDGVARTACAGDTVLIAILASSGALRANESFARPRAGFCLMGACQDCWVEVDGIRVRACTTPVRRGMRVETALDGSNVANS